MEAMTPQRVLDATIELRVWLDRADRMGDSVASIREGVNERARHLEWVASDALGFHAELQNIVRELATKDCLAPDIEPDDIHEIIGKAVAAVRRMPRR